MDSRGHLNQLPLDVQFCGCRRDSGVSNYDKDTIQLSCLAPLQSDSGRRSGLFEDTWGHLRLDPYLL